MSNLSSHKLTNEYNLSASPELSKKFGLSSANFLQKLHYFLFKSATHQHDGTLYWYHTYEDWVNSLCYYSLSTVKRVVKKLTEAGLIIVKKLDAKKSKNTKNYYAINYKELKKVLESKDVQVQEKQPETAPVQTQTDKPIQVTEAPKTPASPPITAPQPLVLKGTAQPTTPSATDIETLAMPHQKKWFYQTLRSKKVDIAHTDPRLDLLLKHSTQVLQLLTYLKRDGIHKYEWHTLEQLQLNKFMR